MKRRTIIASVLAIVALTIGLILYLCARLDDRPVTVTSTGPLDIRFWGIRPDAGDAIYDPNGGKMMETLGVTGGESTAWGDRHYRHDFIFETPETNEPVAFCRLRYSLDGDAGRVWRFARDGLCFERDGRNLWWFHTTVPRTVSKSFLFGAWKRDIPVNRVNLSLPYYCGPPRRPICIFKGPFEAGRKVTDETGLYEVSFVPDPNRSPVETGLRFFAKQNIGRAPDVLFYDTKGKLHWTRGCWSARKGNGIAIRYYAIPHLSLDDIAMVTIGEEFFEITIRNLKLSSPNSEQRTYAEHLDEIAERLGSKRSAERFDRYRFNDLDESLRVIDVLRGDQIEYVCRSLCIRNGGRTLLDPSVLSTEQLQRVKDTYHRWAGALDPGIRVHAAILGMHCNWPGSSDLAFEALKYPIRLRSGRKSPAYHAAEALYRQRERLSERDIERIAEILPRLTEPSVVRRLQQCLTRPESPARITALWDLANCEQTWLWSAAIDQLSRWRQFDGKYNSLAEKLKVRVFLTTGYSRFSDRDQIERKASKLLPTLLSGRLLTEHSGTFSTLLRSAPESVDRNVMTDVMIGSLRHMEYHRDWSVWDAISRIVKYLNLWHGADIGGLGCDVRKQTPDLDKMDLEAIATEAIEWYETVYKTADPTPLDEPGFACAGLAYPKL